MASSINTNMASLVAQRNLATSQSAVAGSVERLSSGLRINRARDDAAGLAISERLTSQVRTVNQASRNAGDAISMLQTGEGALQEVSSMLQRMKELSTQAASDSLSGEQRLSIGKEIDSLKTEVNQVAARTTFNGKVLLNGSAANTTTTTSATGAATFKGAATDTRNASVKFTLGPVGLDNVTPTYDIGDNVQLKVGSAATETWSVDKVVAGTAGADITVDDMVAKFNKDYDGTSGTAASKGLVVASKGSDGKFVLTATGTDTLSATFVDKAATTATDGSYSRTAAAETTYQASSSATAGNVSFAGVKTMTGTLAAGTTFSFTLEGGNSQTYTSTANDTWSNLATNMQTAVTNGSLTGVSVAYAGNDLKITALDTSKNVNGSASIKASSSGSGLQFQVGADSTDTLTVNAFEDIRLGGNGSGDAAKFNAISSALTTFNASSGSATVANAQALGTAIDDVITLVSDRRNNMGALQNRLDHNIANLQVQSENLSASKGRIMDTDYATETAALTKGQVMQQASSAMLAQANQMPNMILSLLK